MVTRASNYDDQPQEAISQPLATEFHNTLHSDRRRIDPLFDVAKRVGPAVGFSASFLPPLFAAGFRTLSIRKRTLEPKRPIRVPYEKSKMEKAGSKTTGEGLALSRLTP